MHKVAFLFYGDGDEKCMQHVLVLRVCERVIQRSVRWNADRLWCVSLTIIRVFDLFPLFSHADKTLE